jgi:hypothetical protein
VHEIMRLGPTAKEWSLAVRTAGSERQIWGFCATVLGRPEIALEGPGSISVRKNGRVVVALRGGRVERQLGIPFELLMAWFSAANDAVWDGVDFIGGSSNGPGRFFAEALSEMVHRVATGGHGGTVLVVPDAAASDEHWRALLRIKYRSDDAAVWRLMRDVARAWEGKRGAPNLEAAESALSAGLRRMADLTAVDGALVVTDRMRILGFGAEVVSEAAIDHVVRPDGTEDSVDSFGTRHRSAFRFCRAYPLAVAFVCSQDGGSRCARVIDGQVRLWP